MPEPAPQQSRSVPAATAILLLTLKTLSQKTLIAVTALYTLLMATAYWFLWYTFLPTMDTMKLIGLGVFGLFLLAVEVIRRR